MTRTIKKIGILLLIISACKGQQTSVVMDNKNPLLCDTGDAVCAIPSVTAENDVVQENNTTKPVKIVYFTDPICSACWGIEPQLRKLKLEYGNSIDIEYRMGGLLPDWSYNSGGISKPSDVAHHWDEVSRYYDMPIDGDVWLEDPLHSSYPPSIAFKAAQMQNNEKALLFLRKIREMVFIQKKNITRWEHLSAAAQQAGLDTAKLQHDYHNDAQRLFNDDLQLSRQMGVRGFPCLFFSDSSQRNPIVVYGVRPYKNFEDAVVKLHPRATKNTYDTSAVALFDRFETLTVREFAELTGNNRQQSENMLNSMTNQKTVQPINTKNGALWVKK